MIVISQRDFLLINILWLDLFKIFNKSLQHNFNDQLTLHWYVTFIYALNLQFLKTPVQISKNNVIIYTFYIVLGVSFAHHASRRRSVFAMGWAAAGVVRGGTKKAN